MKKAIFISLVLGMFLYGCSKPIVKDNITVNAESDDSRELAGKIAIDKIIPLDNSHPIGETGKTVYMNGKYYVHDKSSHEIVCYGESGKLDFIISSRGNGPNEYSYLGNFFIDKYKNEINILSWGEGKILFYSAATGEYIKSESTGYQFMLDGITLGRESSALYLMGPGSNLAIRKNGAEDALYFPFIEIRDVVPSRKAFAPRKDDVLFCYGMNDSVYSIKDLGITSSMYVDFGAYKIPQDIYSADNAFDAVQNIYAVQPVATKIDDLSASDRHLSFSYLFFSPTGVDTRYVLFDKNASRTYNIRDNFFLFPVSDISSGDLFLSVVAPVRIDGENTLPEIEDFMAANNIKEDDNPLVVFWTVKD